MPFLQKYNPSVDWVARTVHVDGFALPVGSGRPTQGPEIEMVCAKTFVAELKQGAFEFCGVLEPVAHGSRAPYHPSCEGILNFIHRAAHGSSAQGGAVEGSGDVSVDPVVSADMLKDLQSSFPTVFSEPVFPIRREHPELYEHRIRLKDESAPPPRRKIYPLDQHELAELKKTLQTWLDSHRIVPSNSPYGAPVLFAQKKNGKLRLCVDYRALNKQTIPDSYPLPRVDELLQRMRGARCFSRLDLRDGYHQLPVATQDQHKTAFSCRYGTFQFTVMTFGFMNAPSTFQRVMNQVFFDLLDDCVVVYLDDILIFSRDEVSHRKALRAVFERLAKHQLYLRPEKCALFLSSVEFLGHVIDASGVHVQQAKVDAITSWPEPTSLVELQQFLGLCNYYRKFIKSYARVAAPLTQLLRSAESRFEFGDAARAGFVALKAALSSAPVLRVFDPDLQSRVLSDASDVACGAILEQKHESGWHPVEYYSKRLSGAESNYGATERELLGCMLALERWRPYLVGQRFELHTDHQPLTYLQSQPKLSRRNARWLDELATFDVTFIHVPGRSHVAADALSRIPPSPAKRKSAASTVAAVVSCPKCNVVHVDSGWFAVHNHVVHVCQACGSKFRSDSACVGVESGASPMPSALCSVLADDEDIVFLKGRAKFAQQHFANAESMTFARRQAMARRSGFVLSHDVVLRDGAIVVPTEALELQADIVRVFANSSGKRWNWRDTLFKSFWWPTAKRDVRECAQGVSAGAGDLVEIGALNPVIVSNPEVADVLHTVRNAQERANDAEWLSWKAAAEVGSRRFVLRDGLVCRERGAGAVAVVVPNDPDCRKALLAKHHDDPLAGHLGVYRMVSTLASRFWWPGMRTDCKEYCRNCAVC